MPVEDVLTPQEASRIAANAYFALKNWINSAPVPGTESLANITNRVLGTGNVGTNQARPGMANPTLTKTALATSSIAGVHTGATGMGVVSGFGYTLRYQDASRTHAIVAMRGTRAEIGAADLLTDARGAITPFGGYGPVHKGFKRTFDSLGASLQRDAALIEKAHIVHCVGHSLGGAVATLVAAHYATKGKAVRLYTFGSPRVGALGTHEALERRIGKQNIYRVAHDLDPISLVGPFPYLHVNGAPTDINNMTLPSPTGSLFSVENHDMSLYMQSVDRLDWSGVRLRAARVDHENSALAKWLTYGDNPSWIQVASAQTLGILLKLFSSALRTVSTSIILKLSAVDFLAEILARGLYMAKELAEKVQKLLGYAAIWAGMQVSKGAQFTAGIVSAILTKMLSTLNMLAHRAMVASTTGLVPMPLMFGGACLLTGCAPL